MNRFLRLLAALGRTDVRSLEVKTSFLHAFETNPVWVPQGQFDRVTSFATTIGERMKETEGLHSISIVKISESEGQFGLCRQEDMKKGEGLYLSALAGVLPSSLWFQMRKSLKLPGCGSGERHWAMPSEPMS